MFAFTLTLAILLTLAALVAVGMSLAPAIEGVLSPAGERIFSAAFIVAAVTLASLAVWGWSLLANPDYARGYEAGIRHAGEMMDTETRATKARSAALAVPAIYPEPNSPDTCQ